MRPLLRSATLIVLLLLILGSIAQAEENDENSKLAEKIASVENGLRERAHILGETPTTFSIESRMRRYRVPGVSITVINDFKVEWSKTYGVMNTATGSRLNTNTRFQAGSISKPITALATLILTKKYGLNLNDQVNRLLKSWRVPYNIYTARNPVTIKQLLDHSSGIDLPWTPGYSPDQPLPQLAQIMDGEAPAVTPGLKVVHFPGQEWRYSNGGYLVLQQLIEDVSGMSFEQFVAENVFTPLGMYDSDFAQPPVGLDALNTAVSHNGKGKPMPGSWHIYPEKAAAGLWTTSADLGQYLVAIMRAARGMKGSPIEGELARAMIRKSIADFGLGFWSLGPEYDPHICHTGTNVGFKSAFHAFPTRGQGVVVLTNGELGETLIDEIVRSVAAQFGWPDFEQESQEASPLSEKELRHFAGTYVFRDEDYFTYIIYRNGTLRFAGEVDPASRLYHARENEFFILDKDWRFTFVSDSSGRIERLVIDTAGRRIECTPTDTQQMAIR